MSTSDLIVEATGNPRPSGWSSVIARARAGCRESFDILARNCWGYLIVVAREKLADDLRIKVAPSDLVQQTLLVGYANIAEFQGSEEQGLLRWLEKILDNQALAAGRYYRNTQARQIDREVPFRELALSPDENILTPSEILSRDEQALRLEHALRELPDHYRTVIRLRSLEQLPFDEIGARTGRTPDAARKLWLIALRTLKENLSNGDDSSAS
jgi:RNA polymerase sigma-70 factor (ECF subfamily)